MKFFQYLSEVIIFPVPTLTPIYRSYLIFKLPEPALALMPFLWRISFIKRRWFVCIKIVYHKYDLFGVWIHLESIFWSEPGHIGNGSRTFCICSGFHRPEHNIHYNDNRYNNCHCHPKANIKTQPFGCSEKSHPNFFPVHCYTSLEQFAIVTDIGFFQTGCQCHIQQDAGNQISKVCCRQSDKSQHRSKGRKGNNG